MEYLFYVLLPAMMLMGDRFDLYGGPAPLQAEALVDISTADPGSPLPRSRARFDPGPGSITGLRFREESAGWGLAMDVAYFRARSPQADLKLLPVSLGVALPSQLTLAGRPGHGSLHPTGMIGLTITSVGGETSLLGQPGTSIGEDMIFPLDNSRVGVIATAGLEWRPSPRLILFTEYRFQQLRFHDSGSHGGLFGPGWPYDASGRFTDQRVVVGLSVPYGSNAPAAGARSPQ